MTDYSIPNIRQRCCYDLCDKDEDILHNINSILFDFKCRKYKLGIFKNQEIIGNAVKIGFENRKILNIMVVAKTQSGKTGSMCSFIKQYLEDDSNIIPLDNIYNITGLSSCEWLSQTKERMPERIQSRVFHGNEFKKFECDISGKKNVLIIMDEIQIAAKSNQKIRETFERIGLLDKKYLYENDIKIIEFTATPNGTIYDLTKWQDASLIIPAKTGEGYISAYDLLRQNRVKQYKKLCGENKIEINENIQELKKDIDDFKTPLYHIIRTENSSNQDETITNIQKIFNVNDYRFIKYDGESDLKDVNDILTIKPDIHTFIFVKEKLRCAKTIYKKFIGILYERYTINPDDSTIIQGLIGRSTGYDDNGFSICYTNIESIERYEELWNSNFDENMPWYTRLKKGNTFNNPIWDKKAVIKNNKEYIILKFKTQEEFKEYYNIHLKKLFGEKSTGPRKKEINDKGFYEANIHKISKIWTTKELEKNIFKGCSNNKYKLYPCYNDINDKTTLEWWFIYH